MKVATAIFLALALTFSLPWLGGGALAAHRKGKRASTEETHQGGMARGGRDRSGEAADLDRARSVGGIDHLPHPKQRERLIHKYGLKLLKAMGLALLLGAADAGFNGGNGLAALARLLSAGGL